VSVTDRRSFDQRRNEFSLRQPTSKNPYGDFPRGIVGKLVARSIYTLDTYFRI